MSVSFYYYCVFTSRENLADALEVNYEKFVKSSGMDAFYYLESTSLENFITFLRSSIKKPDLIRVPLIFNEIEFTFIVHKNIFKNINVDNKFILAIHADFDEDFPYILKLKIINFIKKLFSIINPNFAFFSDEFYIFKNNILPNEVLNLNNFFLFSFYVSNELFLEKNIIIDEIEKLEFGYFYNLKSGITYNFT